MNTLCPPKELRVSTDRVQVRLNLSEELHLALGHLTLLFYGAIIILAWQSPGQDGARPIVFSHWSIYCYLSIESFQPNVLTNFQELENISQTPGLKLINTVRNYKSLIWRDTNNKWKGKQKFYDILALVIANLCQLKRSFNINKTASPSTLGVLLRSAWWRLIWINIFECNRVGDLFKFIYFVIFFNSTQYKQDSAFDAVVWRGAPPGGALLMWMTRHYYNPSFI